LKAGVVQEDGSKGARQKDTPQGGVISPLLANIYLHHCFDKWMDEINPGNAFERYADDIVIHCNSKQDAERLLEKLKVRMLQFKLELHPEKTRVVYCKDYRRKESHDQESFTFLSYTFAPRTIKSKYDPTKMILTFSASISQAAGKHIRERIKEVLYHRRSSQPLQVTAQKLNPKIRGWINYFSRYNQDKVLAVFSYLNMLIKKWIRNTYKLRSISRVVNKYNEIIKQTPELFYHWKLGMTY
jgi:retron-type reverse transcriptase